MSVDERHKDISLRKYQEYLSRGTESSSNPITVKLQNMTWTKNIMKASNRETGKCNFRLQNLLVSVSKKDALTSLCSGIVNSNIVWPQDSKYMFSWKYHLYMKNVMLKIISV